MAHTVVISRYQPLRTLHLVQTTKRSGILPQSEKTAKALQIIKAVQAQTVFNTIVWKINGKT